MSFLLCFYLGAVSKWQVFFAGQIPHRDCVFTVFVVVIFRFFSSSSLSKHDKSDPSLFRAVFLFVGVRNFVVVVVVIIVSFPERGGAWHGFFELVCMVFF